MSGELLSVRLLKPWGQNEAGALVLVDRRRAARLEELGLGSIEPEDNTERIIIEQPVFVPPAFAIGGKPASKAVTSPPRDKMVKRPAKRKGK